MVSQIEATVEGAPGRRREDEIAFKYTGALAYVWKGIRKGVVGRVLSIGGTHARICIGGTGVHTLKRENLIR